MIINVKYWNRSGNTRNNQIIKAVQIINGLQNYYNLVLKPLDKDVVNETYINWDSFCENYLAEDDEYVIFITEKAFDDNWFSHEENQFSIITTNDWEEEYAPPSLSVYLIYQIAQAIISFVGDLSERMEMRMVHSFTKGCMFDLCVNKKDIILGMMAGNICSTCRSNLVRYGISEKAITSVERMLGYVRSQAIGRPSVFDENAAFIVMRFSQNDENDHAYLYGIMPALETLNINCIRADNNISSGQILDKVVKSIEESRFVIIKVDSYSLNVYFELGLAMGKNKDILLISEKESALHLPADLRNWECLTYSKGNYVELKNKIIQFFKDNYHYTT